MICFSVVFTAFFTSPAHASTYGGDAYNTCRYQVDCPTPPPAPSPNTTPSTPTPPPPTVTNPTYEVVPVSPNDGDTVTDNTISVIVIVRDPVTHEPVLTDIGWVSIYGDDQLIGTSYKPDSNGQYSITWNVSKNPYSNISIVAFNENGDPIARHDMKLILDLNVPLENPPTLASTTWIQRVLIDLPAVVVYTFPYWLFLLLLALAIRYIWQAVHEAIANGRMQRLYKKQLLIAEEKDNFTALASHYLLTPLTVMRNGVDTIQAVKEAPETVTKPLMAALDDLRSRIDTILKTVESNEALRSIAPPNTAQLQGSVLTTTAFWLPVLVVCIVIIAMNTLLGLVGKWDLGINNLVIQAIVGIIVIAFLFVAIRGYRLRKLEKQKLHDLVDYQTTVDAARTKLIEQATSTLQESLVLVSSAKAALPATPSTAFVNDGYNRFVDIVSRFELLAQLRAGADYGANEKFSLSDAIDPIISDYQPTLLSRNITLHVNVHGIKTTGSVALFSYVLRTVMDNAVKFSKDGGQIKITASKDSGRVAVSIADNGIGIPADKLPTLFKPFSRAGSALQFDYEGLGFSLFLDRIIMEYLDGDIDASSLEQQGTLVTITA